MWPTDELTITTRLCNGSESPSYRIPMLSDRLTWPGDRVASLMRELLSGRSVWASIYEKYGQRDGEMAQ